MNDSHRPLLRDAMHPPTLEHITTTLQRVSIRAALSRGRYKDEEDDELVPVQSVPGTPSRSVQSSRAPSPTRGPASSRPLPPPLHITRRKLSTDPLRALPTEISQSIFRRLSTRDLCHCSRVSKKWNRSQTLNYIWFQHYRRSTFEDLSLPPGKWTRRESKQNWRLAFMELQHSRGTAAPNYSPSRSPPRSGTQTPRELREERWRQEAEQRDRPGKLELREMYKELGGRKVKGKGRLLMGVGGGGGRDRGGWDGGVLED